MTPVTDIPWWIYPMIPFMVLAGMALLSAGYEEMRPRRPLRRMKKDWKP